MDDQTPIKTRAGRKTKYSPALINKLLNYIADGLNNKHACAAVGIGETTLREWRAEHAGLEEKIEAAREVMRSKVLAEIKKAGAKDWRAHECFLRLAFAEYRFGTSNQVNVAIQNNSMQLTDPERAALIELRENALARKSGAREPDAKDARAIALEAERNLAQPPPAAAEPERLRERPPKTVVERADWREERGGWREARSRDEVDEILGD